MKSTLPVVLILSSTPLVAKASSILSPEAESPAPQSSPSRYFTAPSAVPIERGTGYISQKELMVTQLAYGLTDHLSLMGATSIPFATQGPLGVLGITGTLPLGDHLDIGAGVAYGGKKTFYSYAMHGMHGVAPHAMITASWPWWNLTFATGFAAGTVDRYDDSWEVKNFIPSALAAQARITERFLIVAETWFVLRSMGEGYQGLGVRYSPHTRPWTIDVGVLSVLLTDTEKFPWVGPGYMAPYLDFSYDFGSRRMRPPASPPDE